MSSSAPAGTATSYWCYSCSRFVRVWPGDPIACPDCHGGFLEEVGNPPPLADGIVRRRTPFYGDTTARHVDVGSRRGRIVSGGNRSPFNPVIVFQGSAADGGASSEVPRPVEGNRFELYYDDGTGSGLRPLPQSMSDFLMGSGFDRLLDQLTLFEGAAVGGASSNDNTPASKAAIDSLPVITITSSHIAMDSRCAVCKEAFEIGADAREMPCKHIFHQDCIFPWLLLRNSCPVCRHELPIDAGRREREVTGQDLTGASDNSVGLTIWRLPGGGFAVGRFTGGRGAGERELPVVYTEMDGSFSYSGAPRRISWSSRGSSSRQGRGIGRMIRNFFSIFGCFGSSSSNVSSSQLRLSSGSQSSSRSQRPTNLTHPLRLNNRSFEDGNQNYQSRS